MDTLKDTQVSQPKNKIPAELLEELHKESVRQNRSISWILRKAWSLAREELEKSPPRITPFTHDYPEEEYYS